MTSTYYVDCDGDGYAPVGASFVVACAEPDEGPEGCAEGGWTTRAPTTGATDCADREANAFPGQTEWFETAIADAPAAVDFDYDCDGEETKQFEFMSADSYRACSDAGGGSCVIFGNSWRNLFGGPPACGVVEDLNQCFDGCMSAWAPYRQRCR